MRTITFTADDRQALAHDRYHHPDPRVQRKMEVLWLKSHGPPHDQIAAYADVSRRSVQRYLEKYLEGGLPHLRRCRWHHPQNALAEPERLSGKLFHTGQELTPTAVAPEEGVSPNNRTDT